MSAQTSERTSEPDHDAESKSVAELLLECRQDVTLAHAFKDELVLIPEADADVIRYNLALAINRFDGCDDLPQQEFTNKVSYLHGLLDGDLTLNVRVLDRNVIDAFERHINALIERMPLDNAVFYIADLRPEHGANPYITFWRPKNQGYAYPLPWSGRVSMAEIRAVTQTSPDYYFQRHGRAQTRFPVPCVIAEKLGEEPKPRLVDGNAGPVVANTAHNRMILRKCALKQQAVLSSAPESSTIMSSPAPRI